MSVDERILQALEDDAGPPPADADLERILVSSLVRGRRRRVARRAAVAVGIAAAALLIAIAAPGVLRSAGPDHVPATPALPVAPNPLVGSYQAVFSGLGWSRHFGIHGNQRLVLRADGSGLVQGPGVPREAFSYGVLGSEVAVSLWSDTRCLGIPDGRYSFARRPRGGTSFNVIQDRCPARRWFFSVGLGHSWRAVG
jgi:hypothetical protein